MPRRPSIRSRVQLSEESSTPLPYWRHETTWKRYLDPRHPTTRYGLGLAIAMLPFLGPVLVFLFGFYFGPARGKKLVQSIAAGAVFVGPIVFMYFKGAWFENGEIVSRGRIETRTLVMAVVLYCLTSTSFCWVWLYKRRREYLHELQSDQNGQQIELPDRATTNRPPPPDDEAYGRRRRASIGIDDYRYEFWHRNDDHELQALPPDDGTYAERRARQPVLGALHPRSSVDNLNSDLVPLTGRRSRTSSIGGGGSSRRPTVTIPSAAHHQDPRDSSSPESASSTGISPDGAIEEVHRRARRL
ncbi:uncharacterized protein JCM6883_004487 [Sporobolomyces salmoneus]|uniref:uncharacterized protein n=1 Tax=Sporobolomyces salmoneus TaxID=183962 RepID=UPI003171FE30